MDPALARCLTLAVIICIGAVAVFIATELTAKAELTRPIRQRLLILSAYADRRAPDWVANTLGFFTKAWTCPFCTTFWHGIWVIAMLCIATRCSVIIGMAAYMPAVGLAKLVHDRFARTTEHRDEDPKDGSVASLLGGLR